MRWLIYFVFIILLSFMVFSLLYKGKILLYFNSIFRFKNNRKKTLREENGLPENYDIYLMDVQEKITTFTKSFLVLFLAAYIFYQDILFSLMFALLAFFSKSYMVKYLVIRRKMELIYQFRDALYSMSSSISSGKQMPHAITDTQRNLKLLYSEDDYIVKEFNFMVKRIEETNETLEEIITDFAERTGIEDIRNFADVYVTCRTTGGDLESIIRKTSDVIIEKINIKREIHSIITQKKYEAKILTAMPFIVILFLSIISPGYLHSMYNTLLGRFIMTIGLIAIGAAYKWSSVITDIEV